MLTMLKGVFGTTSMRAQALEDAALDLKPATVSAILYCDPELGDAEGMSGALAWVNTFAGLPEKGERGLKTLFALNNGGIDVKDGLNLAVAYHADAPGGASVISRLLKTGAISQRIIESSLRGANSQGNVKIAEVLRKGLLHS